MYVINSLVLSCLLNCFIPFRDTGRLHKGEGRVKHMYMCNIYFTLLNNERMAKRGLFSGRCCDENGFYLSEHGYCGMTTALFCVVSLL